MTQYHPERGNLFFYIFIAVALFAALSMAISQSGRGSVESLTREQARLRATDIIDYSDAIAKAVGTLRLRGTTLANLRFSESDLSIADYGDPTTGDPINMVFKPEGGGIIYRAPDKDLVVSSGQQLMFLNKNEVDGFGDTCGAATCSDLLMVVGDIKPDVCLVINKLGGVVNRGGHIPSDSKIDLTGKFQGAMVGVPETIGNDTGSLQLSGKSFGCFESDDNNKNYFYRVLWAQ